MNSPGRKIKFQATDADAGTRLDRFLAVRAPDISRTRLQRFIKEGRVYLNDHPVTLPRHRINSGDILEFEIPAPEPLKLTPEAMLLDIIFEDSHIIVINKPAGMVIHPGAGHERSTLVHGLLHHCGDLKGIGDTMRPGIVHRLDKDTSGLVIIAKDNAAHQSLIEQFASRTTDKRYIALVAGKLRDRSGTVNSPIGRHPVHRKKMAAGVSRGKEALTQWKIMREMKGASLIEAHILTGRTHQIRVHMSSIGHPLLGDMLYGGPSVVKLQDLTVKIPRQMLHAAELAVTHPLTRERMRWQAPVPEDMKKVISALS